ncbi:hypothetical protein BRO54_3338 [Geobacillus proteiniphilus]|uniref:Uncharacterized protein n=1 Tax=Geobacillus proteiniphilus TaxID=860353 RepID=A0A1Q5SN72_9BACL|nr:hypothetical protein BRO54_3338 [Geobacillus proteiniphilus]
MQEAKEKSRPQAGRLFAFRTRMALPFIGLSLRDVFSGLLGGFVNR